MTPAEQIAYLRDQASWWPLGQRREITLAVCDLAERALAAEHRLVSVEKCGLAQWFVCSCGLDSGPNVSLDAAVRAWAAHALTDRP